MVDSEDERAEKSYLEPRENLMRNNPSKSERVLAGLRTICGMVAHLAAVAFTGYIIYVSSPGSSKFELQIFSYLGCKKSNCRFILTLKVRLY